MVPTATASVSFWYFSTHCRHLAYSSMTLSKKRPLAWKKRPCFSSGMCFRSRALIIGVSVSEIRAEIRIETASVTANSRKSRPITSPMNSRGIKTAIRETVREMMVKPICFEPLRAASIGLSPSSI